MNDSIREAAAAGCFGNVASLDEFTSRMFPGSDEKPAPRMLDCFYDDYISSGLTLAAYVRAACSCAVCGSSDCVAADDGLPGPRYCQNGRGFDESYHYRAGA